MQAASRQSLVLAGEQLDAYADRATSEELRTLAEQLLSVAELLGREAMLRRALSDPAARESARTRLVDAVFGSHLDEQAIEVLHRVSAARWSASVDLVNALELLGVQALLAAAERDGLLAEVEDELFRFSRVAEGDPQLGAVLGDHSADIGRRSRLVSDLLDGKAHPTTVRLAQLAVAGLGGRGFEASLERLVELAAERRDRTVAYVRAAAPLSEDQEQRLAEALSRTYGRQMSLQVQVDRSVIGGATVRVGDDLYDGSVARRLEQVRGTLVTR